MPVMQDVKCYFCSGVTSLAFRYDRPPEGETRFSFSNGSYARDVFVCRQCGHFMSIHEMDDTSLYGGEYVNSTYGEDQICEKFAKIISLDDAKSDNAGRCDRLIEFADRQLRAKERRCVQPTILDVGSGLCVFLHRMKSRGWMGTALDPDPRAVSHAREVVGVDSVCGDFFECGEIGRFDVVAFNKVLEHVKDPIAMLSKSKDYVSGSGFVYVELPDGEIAATDGASREEFFVEHHHVFSMASIALLAARAGFRVHTIERLREPSTKYTLRAFLLP